MFQVRIPSEIVRVCASGSPNPLFKGLESFEFGYQPSVGRRQIQALSTRRFIYTAKTWSCSTCPASANALGGGSRVEGPFEYRYRVLFRMAATMRITLRQGAGRGLVLFFQLISRWCTRPDVLTSNQNFGRSVRTCVRIRDGPRS
jgi:hypothetical protein